MKSIDDKHTCVFGHSLLPIFNLVRPLHIINVHTDLVVDFGRQLCTVARINIRKDDSGPESLVVQKPHGLIDQPLLICYWLQFVEVHTLRKEMPELWYVLFWPVHNSISSARGLDIYNFFKRKNVCLYTLYDRCKDSGSQWVTGSVALNSTVLIFDICRVCFFHCLTQGKDGALQSSVYGMQIIE